VNLIGVPATGRAPSLRDGFSSAWTAVLKRPMIAALKRCDILQAALALRFALMLACELHCEL
jgi:hypothetical protein